jgi:hypothetical protein
MTAGPMGRPFPFPQQNVTFPDPADITEYNVRITRGSAKVGIRITAVHLDGGDEHEHIAEVEWQNLEWGNVGESSVESVMRWLGEAENIAVVGQRSRVDVVRSPTGSSWLQAVKDGFWSNDLLSLPRY